MGESSDSVSIDIDLIPLGGKECTVKTSKGSMSVLVCGDREKPALITYPDVALNYVSCFQGLLFCPEAASLLLHNFCIYHIDAPGHELGADVISSDEPLLCVDDLADQIAEVLDFFGLREVLCLGVTAGAYVLTLLAMKYKERVLGLILVSPICKSPSWTEWLYNKELRCSVQGAESDIILTCRRLLDERQGLNVMRFLQAINATKFSSVATDLLNFGQTNIAFYSTGLENQILFCGYRLVGFLANQHGIRHDLTEGLKDLQCKTLIFAGESSPFHAESVYMSSKMNHKICALVEVQACGSLVTEEHPNSMITPLERFLMGFGYHRQTHAASSSSNGSNPASPTSHSCIAPELLSPESLGIKLKPIRTRVDVQI
ncbi:hypothetical protein JHK87_057270 [Glycine soja]|nr:hypothetical protein JHK87_057270 [Glycine soja]